MVETALVKAKSPNFAFDFWRISVGYFVLIALFLQVDFRMSAKSRASLHDSVSFGGESKKEKRGLVT